MAHLTSRQSWLLVPVSIAALASAEWLRSPGPMPAAVTLLAAAAALAGTLRALSPRLLRLLAILAVGLGILLGALEYRRLRFVRQWETAGRAIEADVAVAVRGRLARAVRSAGDLALAAAALDTTRREEGFEVLAAMLPPDQSLRNVVLLGPDGPPILWAGQHLSRRRGPGFADLIRTTFFADLEVRHRRPDGMTVVVTVPLDVVPGLWIAGRPLLATIEKRFGVVVEVLPAPIRPPGSGGLSRNRCWGFASPA
jgi:hypothetical protein